MIEKIETERCLLRKVSVDDAQAIFDAYAQDDDVTRYLSWLPHESIQDTIAFMERCQSRWISGEAYAYAIIEKESDLVIGGFDFRPGDAGASFGYVLAKRSWGKGYMTEVLSTMIQVGFSVFGFNKIVGYCDVENIASAKVMENVGMRFIGIEKDYLLLPAFGVIKRDAKVYEIYPD